MLLPSLGLVENIIIHFALNIHCAVPENICSHPMELVVENSEGVGVSKLIKLEFPEGCVPVWVGGRGVKL